MEAEGSGPVITSFSGDHAFLSNFYPCTFSAELLLGREPFTSEWRTVEHFFQASKATTLNDAWRIQDVPTPGAAKRAGRAIELREDWDAIKLDVMLRGVRAKFSQNDALKLMLLATTPRQLIEGNTWGDRYWGAVYVDTGYDGPFAARGHWDGANWLGKILEFVREEAKGRGW